MLDVVLPVYNEVTDLPYAVRRLHRFLSTDVPYPARIVIADNASTDGTLEVARRLVPKCTTLRSGTSRTNPASHLEGSVGARVVGDDDPCPVRHVGGEEPVHPVDRVRQIGDLVVDRQHDVEHIAPGPGPGAALRARSRQREVGHRAHRLPPSCHGTAARLTTC